MSIKVYQLIKFNMLQTDNMIYDRLSNLRFFEGQNEFIIFDGI